MRSLSRRHFLQTAGATAAAGLVAAPVAGNAAPVSDAAPKFAAVAGL